MAQAASFIISGTSATLTKTSGAAPVADFSGAPLVGNVPLAVTFTDLSTNAPTSWLWDFGDGHTSALQNPTHTYTVAGSYTVSLTATNAGGSNTKTRVSYVAATKPAPAPGGGGFMGGGRFDPNFFHEHLKRLQKQRPDEPEDAKKRKRRRNRALALALLLVD